MTRVKGPMFSSRASGTFADTITYQKTLNTISSRVNRFRKYSRSTEQDFIRKVMTWVVGLWHSLHDTKQASWRQYTHYTGLHGYHIFLKLFIARTYDLEWQYEIPPSQGFCAVGNHIVGDLYTGGGFITCDPFNQFMNFNYLPWAVSLWYGLPLTTKLQWAYWTLIPGMAGRPVFINLFIQRTNANLYQYEVPPDYGFCVVGNHLVGEFLVGGELLTPPT